MHVLELYLANTAEKKDRPPSLADLRRIVSRMTFEIPFTRKHGLSVSDLQLTIFFKLLDLDDSGFLEPEEFVDLI